MTEDSTPQPESPSPSAQATPNAAGPNAPRQKQSFRRRRKRRGSGGTPGQAAANSAQQANGAAAPASPGNAPRNENQPRKKKRFFKKNQNQGQGQNQGANARSARGDSRGNSNGQQQRRGGKQRRPKVFVGPMDHSYRAVNGNYADGPPSTIELQGGLANTHYNGNGNGNFNGEYSGAAGSGWSVDDIHGSTNVAAVADDSPVRIYCFIDDLFFMAKIQETARKLGIKVSFVKNDKDTIAEMLALPEEERPRLIVFDLNNANAKPLTLIPKLKTKLKRATSIVGFLSHLQGELKAKAIEAGCDTVMPRSAFSQTLPNLLRRYGIEAEVEDDYQPQILGA
ncbi:MAG: response regulator [Acidobacteriaceae bacterium]